MACSGMGFALAPFGSGPLSRSTGSRSLGSSTASAPALARRTRRVVWRAQTELAGTGVVTSKNAMEFFQHRQGAWESWRVTHHLAFRRDETGMSDISMECLKADDDRIVALCADHDVDPATACGGCYVTWMATMAWDQEGENHEGSTVFALIPDKDDSRKGKILRDRGYAEIVQIAGDYYLDEEDGLNLVTPYDGGEVNERFSFDGPDIVNRVSTVKRFGGLATATFATERRKGTGAPALDEDLDIHALGIFNGFPGSMLQDAEDEPKALFGRRPAAPAGPPSSGSAFSTGFSGAGAKDSASDSSAAPATPSNQIDLSKVPPSMRQDFADSFAKENEEPSGE